MHRTRLRFVLIFSILTLALPPALRAQDRGLFQELAISVALAKSDHPEFPSPRGLGAFAAWDIARHWRLRLGYLRFWDESRKPGLVCRMYAPNIACEPSMTSNEVTLSGLRGGLLRTLVLANWIRVGVGGGLSFNQVDASSVGENGMRADLLAPNSGHIGYLAIGEAQWIPFPGLPLRIDGSVSEHWVDFNTCSGETPPQYDPFCQTARFTEFELGGSFVF